LFQPESLILLTVGQDEREAKVKAYRAVPDSKGLSLFKDMAMDHGKVFGFYDFRTIYLELN
jgi:hypothetical protein